jgi:hypothetical protein
MASVEDAIFLMDDEIICDSIKREIKCSDKKAIQSVSKSLPNDTIIDIAKSQPINIIKPEKTKIKKSTDFFPSSPYTV